MRPSLLLPALFATAACWAADPDLPQTTYELETDIAALLKETGTPAAGVALIDRQGIWAAGIGMADIAAGREAGVETLFRAGSISKSFVAVAVLLLVEAGQLSLDARVADLAPEITFSNPFADRSPVRVVHLLEHTTGFDDIHLREFAYQDPEVGLRTALQYHPDSRLSRVQPGTHYSYTNSGSALAAYIVEKISGLPFETFVERRIFAPLGMTTASWRLTDQARARIATGYWEDGRTPGRYEHIALRPAGALNVSPRELGLFVQMLINDGRYAGGSLLSGAGVERVRRPATTLAAEHGVELGYGLGSRGWVESGFVWHGHDGGLSNFIAEYGYLPQHGLGYVVMLNAPHRETYLRIGQLLQAYLTRDLSPPVPPEPVTLLASELAQWNGYYEPIVTRPELARYLTNIVGLVRVEAGGDELLLRRIGDSVRLLPLGEGRYRRPEDPQASVVFLRSGGARIVQGAVIANGSLREIPAWMASLRLAAAALCLLLMASTLLHALVWIPRRLAGRGYLDIGLRLLPLLAVLTLLGCVGLFYFTEDVVSEFGRQTVRAQALWIGGWSFAALSVLSGLRVLGGGSAALRLYAGLVSLALLAATAYLYYWNLIGLRTWIY